MIWHKRITLNKKENITYMRYSPSDFKVGETVRIYSLRSQKSGVYVNEGEVLATRSKKPIPRHGKDGLALKLHLQRGGWMEKESFRLGERPDVHDLIWGGNNNYLYGNIVKVERIKKIR